MGKGPKSKPKTKDSSPQEPQVSTTNPYNKPKPQNPSETPNSITQNNNLIYLTIRGKPNSKFNSITSIDDESIGISIASQPVDGAANKELQDYLALILGVKKSQVS